VAKYRIVAVAEDRLLVRNFTCDSDEHAVEWAKQLIENHPIELWNHERLVIRLLPVGREKARS